jgi:DNA-binding LacI/PurR family transcriptional regulator
MAAVLARTGAEAVFAASDVIASASSAPPRGRPAIPEDVSVIGFDDIPGPTSTH